MADTTIKLKLTAVEIEDLIDATRTAILETSSQIKREKLQSLKARLLIMQRALDEAPFA